VGDEFSLDELASAVAERAPIDWDRAEQSAADGSERSAVKALRVVAKMAEVVAAPAGTELRLNEKWGHLRVSEIIGEGSFGRVYRAWDTQLEREVALKLVKASGVSPTFDLARAIKEARLLARVRHPNVVCVFGADSHAGRFGLWMELISGRTLGQVLKLHGPMSVNEAIAVGIDLCHALAAVHRAGLLHRDVKAQNVLREEGGRIVLMDFGTGHPISGAGATADSLAGTPLYLAPELFSGATPSAASDIYSLGVLLYHLVTVSYPVSGRSRSDVEAAHRADHRQPLRDARPDLSPAFVDVVERALARAPEARYRSAGEFGNALASVTGGTYSHDQVPSAHRWRRPQLAVAAAAVAGLLLAFILFDRRPAQAPDVTTPTAHAVDVGPTSAASTSYQVKASFYARRDGSDVALAPGSRVRPGDELFAVIDASKPVFVYIINRDDAGQSFLLFPLSGLIPANPVKTDQMVRLPGMKDGEQIYWKVTSAGGQEHFFLYVTPTRLVDFEELLAALPRAELGRSVSSLPLSTSALGVLRGVGGLSAATDSQTPGGTELIDLLPLSDRNEFADGVWARRVSFQNPGK
jgi:eukaryotic-like serine/threonine-protein kinase